VTADRSFLAERTGRRCHCGASLDALINWSWQSCPECREYHRDWQRKRYATKAGRARKIRQVQAYYRRNAEERREWLRNLRAQRQLDGICTNCPAPAADGSNLCTRCHESHRKAAATVAKRKYAEWVAADKCRRCGADRDSDRMTCVKCREYKAKVDAKRLAKRKEAA
jgi:uncharacterized OB-fold protein